jgi:hypothetical protein
MKQPKALPSWQARPNPRASTYPYDARDNGQERLEPAVGIDDAEARDVCEPMMNRPKASDRRKPDPILVHPPILMTHETTGKHDWSRRSGLNRRPADYESAALPLSYAGATIIKRDSPTQCQPIIDHNLTSIYPAHHLAGAQTIVGGSSWRLGIGGPFLVPSARAQRNPGG